MDDREMLEWAAKAAGYEIGFSTDYTGTGIDGEMPYLKPSGDEWNPLTDDGDRYRLAQKLRINIDFEDCCAWKRLPEHTLIQEFWGGECGDEAHAVLRVAAEIGRRMNSGSSE